jgi:putative transposase
VVPQEPEGDQVLPLLYLHGLSGKDFVPALEQFPGSVAGLSASAITRLTEAWQEEHRRWCEKDLSGADYVYCWADGLHFGVRLGEDRVCTLVVIGVRADGKKELVALANGHRESAESWAGLLRDARRRGMRAPVLAVGDGALGFWAALAEVFPQTRHGRCWVHKVVNVLDCLPKSAQPAARKALAGIRDAEDRQHAEKAITDFAAACKAKYPKAVAKITGDQEQLLAFYDFPAEHWVHLKTSNPIESAFSTVRLRTRVTKGPGSRAAGLAMVFKLIEAARDRWRYVNGPHLVALVGPGPSSRKECSSSGQTRPSSRSPRDQFRTRRPQHLTIPRTSAASRSTSYAQSDRCAASSRRGLFTPKPATACSLLVLRVGGSSE